MIRLRWLVWASALALAVCCPSEAQRAKATQKRATKPSPAEGSASARQIAIRDETFHAASLARDMKYRVILPADYGATARRYPVLYLLHGAWGDYKDWESKSYLAEYVRPLPLVVVMPDADESWYTNSASVPQDRFEDYIVKDLLQDVEAKFHVIRERHGRAVAGLSMGGYGAIKYALKYPQLFQFAASFSGAFIVPAGIENAGAHPLHQEWLKVFGPPGNPARAENDLLQLAQKPPARVVPYLWLSCGAADEFLSSNRDLVRELQQRGIAYEYHETPGAHTWDFWDRQIRNMLPVLIERLKYGYVNPGLQP